MKKVPVGMAMGRCKQRYHRALFSRVDERQYVALLEQELSARGVDVAALASTLKHNRFPEV